MPSCSSCGVARPPGPASAPCAKCGAREATPDLELDMPKRAPPPRPPARKLEEVETKLELAVDPRSFNVTVADLPPAKLAMPAPAAGIQRVPQSAEVQPSVGDVAFDARLLAEYGDVPRHWVFSPLYAWRVIRRRRELKKGLAGRRDEASRAAHEVDDALVAFAERARPVVEKHAEYTRVVEELRGAEDMLRSRDRVLASEQDAQTARLAAVDARLAKFEAEVAQAQSAERAIAAELASTQAGLARGESKLKRAESELRTAEQREADGTPG